MSSATCCMTLLSRMSDLLDEVNPTRPPCGLISYADDFVICTNGSDANEVWKKAGEALAGIGPTGLDGITVAWSSQTFWQSWAHKREPR